jgi:hypothetical protein
MYISITISVPDNKFCTVCFAGISKIQQTPAYVFCSLIGYFEQDVPLSSDTQIADAKIDLAINVNSILLAISPAFFLIRDIGR